MRPPHGSAQLGRGERGAARRTGPQRAGPRATAGGTLLRDGDVLFGGESGGSHQAFLDVPASGGGGPTVDHQLEGMAGTLILDSECTDRPHFGGGFFIAGNPYLAEIFEQS